MTISRNGAYNAQYYVELVFIDWVLYGKSFTPADVVTELASREIPVVESVVAELLETYCITTCSSRRIPYTSSPIDSGVLYHHEDVDPDSYTQTT